MNCLCILDRFVYKTFSMYLLFNWLDINSNKLSFDHRKFSSIDIHLTFI